MHIPGPMCLHHPFTSPSSMTMKSWADRSGGSCGPRVSADYVCLGGGVARGRKHPQFDCLVLDIELGGMSGIELAGCLLAKGAVNAVHFHQRA